MSHVTILVGDARQRLAEVADQSVQCCVTSPPYFGLRDYGHAGQMGLEQTPEAYVAELVGRDLGRVVLRAWADHVTASQGDKQNPLRPLPPS